MMDEEMIYQSGRLQDLTFSGVEAEVVAAGLRGGDTWPVLLGAPPARAGTA